MANVLSQLASGLGQILEQANDPTGRTAAIRKMGATDEDKKAALFQNQTRGQFKNKLQNTVSAYKGLNDAELSAKLKDNKFFQGDVAKFKQYVTDEDFQAKIEGRGGRGIGVSDIYKMFGDDETTRYLNQTGLSQTYLGKNKWVSGEVNYGLDPESGELAMLNPTVRRADTKSGKIHSANFTMGGQNVKDIFKKEGREGVEAASVGAIPLSMLDQVDRDFGMALANRSGSDVRLGMAPDPDFGNRASTDAYYKSQLDSSTTETTGTDGTDGTDGVKTEGNQDDSTFRSNTGMGFDREIDPNTVENPEGPSEVKLTAEETVAKLEKVERSLSMFDSLTGVSDVEAQAGRLDTLKAYNFKSMDGLKVLKGIKNAGLEGYTFDPAGEAKPLDIDPETYNLLGSRGQVRALALATAVSNYNVTADLINPESNPFNALIDQMNNTADGIAEVGEDTAGIGQAMKNNRIIDDFLVSDAGVTKNLTPGTSYKIERSYLDNRNTKVSGSSAHEKVSKFSGSKLGKRLVERPDLNAEFKQDPQAFILKYANDKNALYGPPKNKKDINSNAKIAAGTDQGGLIQGISEGDPDAVEEALGKTNNINSADEARIATQLADPNTAGRYTSPERVNYIAGMLSSLDPDSFLFKAFVGSDGAGLRSFITSGKLDFTQETLDIRRAELAERHNTAYRTWKQKQETAEKPKEFAFVGGWTGNETEDLYTIDPYTKERILGGVVHRESTNRMASTLFNSILKTGRDRGYLMQNEQATIDSIQDFRIGQAKTVVQLEQERNRGILDNVLITLGFKAEEGRTIFEINPNLRFFTSDNKPITTKEQLLAMSPNDMKFMKAKTRGNREDVSLNSLNSKLGYNIVYDVALDSLPFGQ